MTRLTRLRPIAPPVDLIEIAIPSRGPSRVCCRARTVNNLSVERTFFLNTPSNSARCLSLRCGGNFCALLVVSTGLLAVPQQPVQSLQGVSRARPLARRRARIWRPLLLAILALKPCVRLRRRLLGWNVRFIDSVPEIDVVSAGVYPGTKGRKS